MTLEGLLAEYGLWALALGAGVEGETVLVLGGVMAHRGLFSIGPAIAAAAAGSFVADQIFFALGRRFRDHAVVRRAQARPAFQRVLQAFERRPTLFVFGFRFLYGLRTISPMAIGTTTLPAGRFLVINAAAALVWSAVFVTLGALFGQAVEAAFGRIHSLERLLLPALAAALVVAVIVRLARRGRARPAPGAEASE